MEGRGEPSVPNLLLPAHLLPPLCLLQQLRLSLLNFASQFNPSHTPISHTQYFVAPTEFWASLRQQHHSPPSQTPASSTIDLFSPPASPRPETSSSTVTGGEQGLLEGLVGGLEVSVTGFVIL